MDYKLIFDLQSSDIRLINYLYLLPGVIIFCMGAITYFFRGYFTDPLRNRPLPQRLPFFLLLLGALWMQLSALSLFSEYRYLETALRTGKVNVAEGKVAHFQPTQYPTNQMEHFCVTDTEACFSYSDYVVTPGFSQTTASGGPIQNGLPVRITYSGNTILKLEVARQDTAYAQIIKTSVPPEAALSPAR